MKHQFLCPAVISAKQSITKLRDFVKSSHAAILMMCEVESEVESLLATIDSSNQRIPRQSTRMFG